MLLLVNVKKYQEVDDVITHLEANIFDRFVFYSHIIENTLIQSALTVFISSHLSTQRLVWFPLSENQIDRKQVFVVK